MHLAPHHPNSDIEIMIAGRLNSPENLQHKKHSNSLHFSKSILSWGMVPFS